MVRKYIVLNKMIEKINELTSKHKNNPLALTLALVIFTTNNSAAFAQEFFDEEIDLKIQYELIDDKNKIEMVKAATTALNERINELTKKAKLMEKEKSPEEIIMEKYNLTYEEFLIVCAVVLTEASGKGSSYEDSYKVINVIYNRTKSVTWSSRVEEATGLDGTSLYAQVISPGQFEVYTKGIYKERLGVTNLDGYRAILDFLLSEETVHNYLKFYGDGLENHYYSLLTDDDRIFVLKRGR